MKFVIIFLLLVMFTSIQGVTADQILEDSSYIIGEGKSEDENTADNSALSDLMSQIAVDVESSFKSVVESHNGVVSKDHELIMKTYSSATLYNTEKIVDKATYAPTIYVLRYIKRSQVDDIFKYRKSTVNSLIREGEKAEKDNRIADALQKYYWAYALLPTIPEYMGMTYCFGEEELCSYTSLESKINYILNNIDFSFEDKFSTDNSNYVDVIVQATYKNKPVDNIMISYHDGYTLSKPSTWSDGIGEIKLSKSMAETSDSVTLYIDYRYRYHTCCEDVIEAIDNMKYKRLPASEKKLEIKGVEPIERGKIKINLKKKCCIDNKIKNSLKESITNISEKILKKNFGGARQYFTLAGYSDFSRLLDYGNAELMGNDFTLDLMKINDHFIVGSLPMLFSYKDNKETFSEKVNFIYNSEGKVDKITFALSDKSQYDINNHKKMSKEEKAEVIYFMELYKTAYCLKDLEFLENVFADDALIIVGTVVKKDPEFNMEGLIEQLGADTVNYIRYEKEDFIKRLSTQFQQKEFINLHFSDTSLKSLENTDNHIYGIQIEQYYYSNNYADNGYLFLMFNLNEPDKPRITVRSWQPEKFEDGSIIGLEDFRF